MLSISIAMCVRDSNTHKQWLGVEINRVVALRGNEGRQIDGRGEVVVCWRALVRTLRRAPPTLALHIVALRAQSGSLALIVQILSGNGGNIRDASTAILTLLCLLGQVSAEG